MGERGRVRVGTKGGRTTVTGKGDISLCGICIPLIVYQPSHNVVQHLQWLVQLGTRFLPSVLYSHIVCYRMKSDYVVPTVVSIYKYDRTSLCQSGRESTWPWRGQSALYEDGDAVTCRTV